jgi:hypothetical protein
MLKNSKLLFWLIPFLVILLGFGFYDYVYMAIQAEMQTLDELKELKQKTLEKYISAINQKGALEQRINALKESRKNREKITVEGQTPAVAAANLQNLVKGIIIGKGGTISSESAEKSEDLNHLKVITVSVDTILPETNALYDILNLFETNPVTLLIRELDVRVRNMREPRELTVKFKVSALNMGK